VQCLVVYGDPVLNVLLINPDSPRNVGAEDKSIQFIRKKAYVPPLGLITVAALLPQDWGLKLVDLTFQEIRPSDWDNADLVIVSGTILQLSTILEIVREGKRRGKLVAAGGPGVFHFPQAVLKAGADFVVRGEGELTVPRLLESLKRKESGVVIESGGVADLTQTPAPRYDLLDMDAYVEMSMQFSRGCPFRCEFCDVTLIFGRGIRTKTPRQMLDELDVLYRLGWRHHVWFIDDNFVGSPVKARQLLQEMIEWNRTHRTPFEFFTFASVNLAGFPDVMDLLVRANFTRVYLGIETTDKEALKIAQKFQNASVDIEEACRKINRAGLQIIALTMVGFDGEAPRRDRRIIDFANRLSIPEVDTTLVYAFPGTTLWERLKGEGRLLNVDTFEITDWKKLKMNFLPTRPESEILAEYVNVYDTLYEPAAYLERSYRHIAQMGRHPAPMPFKPPSLFELRVMLKTGLRWGIVQPTRWLFWKCIVKLLLRFNRERFALFIRSAAVLERYLYIRSELVQQLRQSGGVTTPL